MQHTVTILVLLFITFVCSQTSTNPNGAPFFSPSSVRQLPLDNTPINSVLLESPNDYSDFYWGYIPENVGSISITLNVSNSCSNTVRGLINFAAPNEDSSFSFPCNDGSYLCSSNIDGYFLTASGTSDTQYFLADQFRPGKNFYVTLYQYYIGDQVNCSYSIQANNEFNCSAGTALAVYGDSWYCLSYSNVTSDGQTFSGTASSSFQSTNVYRIDVPKNVTMVYAWVTSQSVNMQLMASGGFAPLSSSDADRYNSEYGGNLAANTSLYTYYLEYYMPDGDFPVFFSVKSTTDGNPYTVSFHWEYCGATKAGYGQTNQNFSTAVLNFDFPPCSSSVEFTNMNLGSGQNYTFIVPADNTTAGVYGSAYGYLDVPVGTYGAINLSCVSNSTGSSFIAYSRDQGTDCSGYYLNTFNCNGDIIPLISQDLYSGGYWTFGACSSDSQPISVTLVVSGSVTAPPSPSPVPSASPSPGSATGQDSSTGMLTTPTMILIALVAIIQL